MSLNHLYSYRNIGKISLHNRATFQREEGGTECGSCVRAASEPMKPANLPSRDARLGRGWRESPFLGRDPPLHTAGTSSPRHWPGLPRCLYCSGAEIAARTGRRSPPPLYRDTGCSLVPLRAQQARRASQNTADRVRQQRLGAIGSGGEREKPD